MVTVNNVKCMRIVSLNANGIRAAARKGMFDWLAQNDVDVLCLQETKAQIHQLDDDVFHPPGYHRYFHDAERKGYSGVAIYTRLEPEAVVTGLGWTVADAEGRYLQCDFADFSVASIYLPSGTSGDERQTLKYEFMDQYLPKLQAIAAAGKPTIICGDWNIAHKQIDLKNWKGNLKNSGFLPEERAWLDQVFGEVGLVDAFRVLNQEEDQFTWWSNRGQAWAKNVGWRIDYQVVTPDLSAAIKRVDIYKDERFSDHAPLIVDYALG